MFSIFDECKITIDSEEPVWFQKVITVIFMFFILIATLISAILDWVINKPVKLISKLF